jgi:hypothetical protein
LFADALLILDVESCDIVKKGISSEDTLSHFHLLHFCFNQPSVGVKIYLNGMPARAIVPGTHFILIQPDAFQHLSLVRKLTFALQQFGYPLALHLCQRHDRPQRLHQTDEKEVLMFRVYHFVIQVDFIIPGF